MRARGWLLSGSLLLAGCGDRDDEPAEPSADLALPVTAPMGARQHLLDELDAHERREQQRARTLDGLMPSRR